MISTRQITTFEAKDGSEITLRPVEPKDASKIVQQVAEIIKQGFIQKEEPKSVEEEERFIAEMNEKTNMYTAIERSGSVVGIARVVRSDLDMKRHTGVFRIWLVDTVQGLGIGKKVLHYTFDWCIQHNLHKLWLTVFSSNEGAYYLYKKVGFIEEGNQRNQVIINGSYEDEIFMAKFFDK